MLEQITKLQTIAQATLAEQYSILYNTSQDINELYEIQKIFFRQY